MTKCLGVKLQQGVRAEHVSQATGVQLVGVQLVVAPQERAIAAVSQRLAFDLHLNYDSSGGLASGHGPGKEK